MSEKQQPAQEFETKTAVADSDSQPSGRDVILVIDDSSTVRSAMTIYLERNGYKVVSAVDGFAGMHELSKIQPIIVFADIVMPRVDGLEFCMLVNSNESLKDIPIVLVSSKDQVFDRARARMAGCCAFLSKPFTEQQLLDVIAQHARRVQLPRPSEYQLSQSLP